MKQRHRQPQHASRQNADQSGGKLPPMPLSDALRKALFTEAYSGFRSPRDQALVILQWYFGLFPYHPADLTCGQTCEPPPRYSADEINRALADIERLSGDEQDD